MRCGDTTGDVQEPAWLLWHPRKHRHGCVTCSLRGFQTPHLLYEDCSLSCSCAQVTTGVGAPKRGDTGLDPPPLHPELSAKA